MTLINCNEAKFKMRYLSEFSTILFKTLYKWKIKPEIFVKCNRELIYILFEQLTQDFFFVYNFTILFTLKSISNYFL